MVVALAVVMAVSRVAARGEMRACAMVALTVGMRVASTVERMAAS